MKRHIFSYSIGQLTPYIDWSYLYHAWGIDPTNSTVQASELVHDAKTILDKAADKQQAHGIFALCDARSDGDNIIVEGRTLPLLRQQHSIDGVPNLCLSDFVSPQGDKIGLFATCIDSTFGNGYADDTYLNLLAQTLADRLAEATATFMHREIRTDSRLWGYAPDEHLTPEQLNREEYQGIRPAVGYPSLPDQSIIFIIDNLLHLNDAGITLTANGAMTPHAAVCGLMISHPAARYFAVGKIGEEQLSDYAGRRGIRVNEMKRFLTKNIL